MMDYREAKPRCRVLLPAGTVTTARPRIEWRLNAVAAGCRVRVRGADAARGRGRAYWESAELPGNVTFAEPAVDLPQGKSLVAEVCLRDERGWQPWGVASVFRVQLVPPLQGEVVLFDLHYTRKLSPIQAFEHAHLVAVLQGLVNRQAPRLYVNFIQGSARFAQKSDDSYKDIDRRWFEKLRRPGAWLSDCRVRVIETLPELLAHFREACNGVVVWDEAVPATSNVASTVAAADDLLPVRGSADAGSLYRDLVEEGPRLPVRLDLRGRFTGSGVIPDTGRESTGSAKCDAYLWAAQQYLVTGRSNHRCSAHYIDAWWARNPGAAGNLQNHTLTNHDYFVSQRAFFWDLNVWTDETPVDDAGQPVGTDGKVLREIMAVANRRSNARDIIHVGGFTPWAQKYTSHKGAGGKHEPVESEWELVRVLSAYNAYVDADALGLGGMANASFVTHFPLPGLYTQVLHATPEEMKQDGVLTPEGRPAARDFLLNYVGDYDSAAWCWSSLSLLWDMPERGAVLLPWAVNPNLALRAAPLFEEMYRTRTAQDYFMTGDSGAGYVNPTQLFGKREPSGLPDNSHAWEAHCTHWYRRFGLRFTGFLINGLAGHITPEVERLYKTFSPDGVVNQYGRTTDKLHMSGNHMPAFELIRDVESLDEGVPVMKNYFHGNASGVRFGVFRQILQSPAFYMDMRERLTTGEDRLNLVLCDPHTFGCLARVHKGGSNDNLVSLLYAVLAASNGQGGDVIPGEVAFRNDGWNTWRAGDHHLLLSLVRPGAGDSIWHGRVPVPNTVAPGECVLFNVDVPLPDFPGRYILDLDLAEHGVPFSNKGGYNWEVELGVV